MTLILLVLALAPRASAQTLTIGQAAGGVSFINFILLFTSFGTMNALGIGAPQSGVTAIPLSNGALYYSPYKITVAGLAAGHKAIVTAYVSNDFNNPAALVMENCPNTLGCTSSGNYSTMSTVAGSPSAAVPSPGIGNTSVNAGFAIFLPDNNGASAFTGTDTAQITFTLKDASSGTTYDTQVVYLTLPQETVQDAVQLTLGTAPGGATIATASDFSLNFGNVNALGIGPGTGLTTTPIGGGMIYHTPYLIQPAFSGMSSTTATVKVYVSTNFAHPTLLTLNDSSSTGGPYNAISTSAGAQTQISATAADRTPITRYLGLFVSNVNGASAFNGTDSATLTFTMTVP